MSIAQLLGPLHACSSATSKWRTEHLRRRADPLVRLRPPGRPVGARPTIPGCIPPESRPHRVRLHRILSNSSLPGTWARNLGQELGPGTWHWPTQIRKELLNSLEMGTFRNPPRQSDAVASRTNRQNQSSCVSRQYGPTSRRESIRTLHCVLAVYILAPIG